MLTMNWYRFMQACFSFTDETSSSTSANGFGANVNDVVAPDGSTKSFAISYTYNDNGYGFQGLITPFANSTRYGAGFTAKRVSTSYSSSGIVFGNGTEAPNINDYKLSGDLITTISYQRVSAIRASDNSSATVVYNITNTGSEAITISEYGMIYAAYSGSSNRALVFRALMDTPITIPPEEVARVEITIGFDLPQVDE